MEPAEASPASDGWFYLHPTGQSYGPYATNALQELYTQGYVRPEFPIWKQGMSEWVAFSQVPEASAGAVAPTSAAVVQHARVDELSRFQAEIGQLETPQYDPADMAFDVEEVAVPSLAAAVKAVKGARGDEADALTDALEAERKGKRGAVEALGDDAADGAEAATDGAGPSQGGKKKAKKQQRVNTSVYVTGLPEDATEAELATVFRKCGIIREDDDGNPKVKVYRNDSGRAKGDGLVVYLKEPSVLLAMQILDGVPFRDGLPKPMSVTEATFEGKGDGDAKKPPRKGPKGPKKKKGPNKAEEQLSWDGFDDEAKESDATVVLKNMFDPAEVQGNKGTIKDLHNDVVEECRKHGSIGRIKIFAWNPEGVVSVRFMTVEGAAACIEALNGRAFGGRRIVAGLWDGVTNFYRDPPKETEEEQAARLEAFARELEEGE